MTTPDKYLFKRQAPYSMFLVPPSAAVGRSLSVVARDGVDTGWDHVSVASPGDSTSPSDEEMAIVKSLFWEPEERESVFQDDNHLWRCCWLVELKTKLLFAGVP